MITPVRAGRSDREIRAFVIMGVSGCGKSTLGAALATALGWEFVEGDGLHPQSNVDKMSAGIALDDDDRLPFLGRVADTIAVSGDRGVVVSCSALKRRYRDLIRSHAAGVLFVLPKVPRDTLRERLEQRSGHFMPAMLLDSQLADLEEPGPDEAALIVDGTAPLAAQIGAIRSQLTRQRPSG